MVDPRPVEAARLDDTADSMMDMVRRHLAEAKREQLEPQADDQFSEEEHLEEELLSPYEVIDLEETQETYSLEDEFQAVDDVMDAVPGRPEDKSPGVNEDPPPAAPTEGVSTGSSTQA